MYSDYNAPSRSRAAYTNRYETPLYAAVREGHYEVVDMLLRHNADVNIPEWRYALALEGALRNEDDMMLQLLLSRLLDVPEPYRCFDYVIIQASRRGLLDVVRVLLASKGGLVDTQSSWFGYSLVAASQSHQIPILKLLLSYEGANRNFCYQEAISQACRLKTTQGQDNFY